MADKTKVIWTHVSPQTQDPQSQQFPRARVSPTPPPTAYISLEKDLTARASEEDPVSAGATSPWPSVSTKISE